MATLHERHCQVKLPKGYMFVIQMSDSQLTHTRVLKPGGWVQMVDCYYMCQSDSGSITDESALRQWSTKYIQSLADMKDPRAPLQLQNMCNAAGLVSVESRMIPLPLCEWSSGKSFYSLLITRTIRVGIHK